MEVRAAEAKDMGAVSRIYRESWQNTYRGILPDAYLAGMSDEKGAEKWTKYRSQTGRFVFVAEGEDGLVKGFAAVRLDSDMNISAKPTGMLDSLHVARECHGMGMGRRLLEAAARCLGVYGVRRMQICVLVGNEEAMGMYAHLGAVREKLFTDSFEGALVDSILMVWEDIGVLVPEGSTE